MLNQRISPLYFSEQIHKHDEKILIVFFIPFPFSSPLRLRSQVPLTANTFNFVGKTSKFNLRLFGFFCNVHTCFRFKTLKIMISCTSWYNWRDSVSFVEMIIVNLWKINRHKYFLAIFIFFCLAKMSQQLVWSHKNLPILSPIVPLILITFFLLPLLLLLKSLFCFFLWSFKHGMFVSWSRRLDEI